MSRLYPSLEDMKVDKMQTAQSQAAAAASSAIAAQQHQVQYPDAAAPAYGQVTTQSASSGGLYPSLGEYMGMDLSVITQVIPPDAQQVAIPNASGNMIIAPVSGNDVGIRRAEIKGGVREVTCCKDGNGKVGLRVRAVNKGVFVAFVHNNSPAAMAGMRFGDQILQINGENVAGWDTEKTMNKLKRCNPEKIIFALRDRPFERTITMQKDSSGHVGFVFKDGKISAVVKDSSAARNGILTEHHLIEINGQNVVGLKDKEILKIFDESPQTCTITLMPTVLYEHIVKCMGKSLIKNLMDHSIPDF